MLSPISPAITAARGAHVWDTAGTRYVDWICGYGPIVLGHGHPRVAAAVYRQMLTGTLLPGFTRQERKLGGRLLRHFPHAEDYRFFKTGSEAVAAAIRLARAHNGRTRVLRVGFHGWHDGLIDSKIGWHNWDNHRTDPTPVPGAMPHSALGITTNLAQHTDEIEAAIRATSDTPAAALLLDPIQLANPGNDLPRLRQACDDTGTLLLLDETKTAFRVAPGGVQELYGVPADITVAGKALANGLPLSSVLGPETLMRHTATARIKGTFTAELTAITAANTTLDILEAQQVCEHLAVTGRKLIEGINTALEDTLLSSTLRAVPYRWPAMPHLHAPSNDHNAQRLRQALVDQMASHGVLMLANHNSFVSAAHTDDDIAATVHAAHQAARHLDTRV